MLAGSHNRRPTTAPESTRGVWRSLREHPVPVREEVVRAIWKEHDAYQHALERLLRDLRVEAT